MGKLILRAATNDLKKVSLELGGKSPNVVLRDADLDLAVKGTANAIFFNHGQCCCAGSRLFVQESIFDKLVGGVADEAKKIKVGPGLDPKTQMGPMVSEASSNASAVIWNLALQKERRRSRVAGSWGAKGILLNPLFWWTPNRT
ncbi:MAG: aldehyde dehydrogenase family protein [Methyloceanibacter sp.]